MKMPNEMIKYIQGIDGIESYEEILVLLWSHYETSEKFLTKSHTIQLNIWR